MQKFTAAVAALIALTAAPAIAKGHGHGHGNGHGGGPAYGHGSHGCPPGLRNKGCMPPGQAKKLYRIGQRWPSGYGAYNLPSSYRTRYVDSRRAYYRYSDGYIYQIDPRTQIIQQVISALLR